MTGLAQLRTMLSVHKIIQDKVSGSWRRLHMGIFDRTCSSPMPHAQLALSRSKRLSNLSRYCFALLYKTEERRLEHCHPTVRKYHISLRGRETQACVWGGEERCLPQLAVLSISATTLAVDNRLQSVNPQCHKTYKTGTLQEGHLAEVVLRTEVIGSWLTRETMCGPADAEPTAHVR
jgi:hypothetical protein